MNSTSEMKLKGAALKSLQTSKTAPFAIFSGNNDLHVVLLHQQKAQPHR